MEGRKFLHSGGANPRLSRQRMNVCTAENEMMASWHPKASGIVRHEQFKCFALQMGNCSGEHSLSCDYNDMTQMLMPISKV